MSKGSEKRGNPWLETRKSQRLGSKSFHTVANEEGETRARRGVAGWKQRRVDNDGIRSCLVVRDEEPDVRRWNFTR